MQFTDLKLIEPLLRAVIAEGYTTPTPIQEQAIPYVLARRDLVGVAQTGTGKTAAFALPILQRLVETPATQQRAIRVLVLSPTRELATQIGDSFNAYGKNVRMRTHVIFGGVGQQPQVAALQRGIDVLVATPGRLLDLMQQGLVRLNAVEIFVLDEADRMLDMGFIHDVKRIIATLPVKRQNLLFSATMPPDVEDLARRFLQNPAKVEVVPQATTVEKIEQSLFYVQKTDKFSLLEFLLQDRDTRRVLVFTRTKHGANKVVQMLDRARIGADAIHGNKSQSARERALANFKSGVTRVLVATDIAARGIDVDDVTHVVNYDLPEVPESYVHRIGRTARAGASGKAYAFCDAEERDMLRDIEKTIRMAIPVVKEHPFVPAPGAFNGQPSRPTPRPQSGSRPTSGGRNSSAGRPSSGGRPGSSSRSQSSSYSSASGGRVSSDSRATSSSGRSSSDSRAQGNSSSQNSSRSTWSHLADSSPAAQSAGQSNRPPRRSRED